MQEKEQKNIGKVVAEDFNNNPAPLNDTSDVDIGELQYTSTILDKMIEDGVYETMCHLVKAIKLADKSDSFIVAQIKKRFPTYCGALTAATFKRWLGGEYRELKDAYYFGRDIALGELMAITMNVARKNSTTIEGGEYALKLMDRLDDGRICAKNKPDNGKSDSGSTETAKTLGKLMVELTGVKEPPDLEDGGDNDESE